MGISYCDSFQWTGEKVEGWQLSQAASPLSRLVTLSSCEAHYCANKGIVGEFMAG